MDSFRSSLAVAALALWWALAWAAPVRAAAPADVAAAAPEDAVHPPEPDSLRAQAIAALERAGEMTLYSLQPWQYPRLPARWERLSEQERDRREQALVERSEREWCVKGQRCFYRNQVLGRTRLGAADRATVRAALNEAVGQVPDEVSLCAPEYRHAVSFVSDGRRFDVLLCYECGQVLVAADGRQELGQAGRMGSQRAVDAILRRAGIALARAPADEEE